MMQNHTFGEFDNFDDFFNDILDDLNSSIPEPDINETKLTGSELNEKIMCPVGEDNLINNNGLQRFELESEISHKNFQHSADSVRNEHPCRYPVKSGKCVNNNSRKSFGISSVFLTVLFSVTVIAWSIPLRPTFSVSEKRNLETFPVFSTSDFFSGVYFKSIETWFADTFTFRDGWMKFSDEFKKCYGINSIAIYGDVPVHDSIPIPAPVEHQDSDSLSDTANSSSVNSESSVIFSDSKNDSQPSVEDGHGDNDEIGNEENDDFWGGVTISEDELIADKGGKLMIGDSVFLYPGFNQSNSEKYADIMNQAADLLESKANYYSLIVPENVTSMLSRSDREKYNFVIEEDAFAYMYSLMDSNVHKVNVIENLQKHNDEYITFRTDHHWTAVGAYYAYEEWCRVTGKTPVPLSDYEELVWEDFYGTYYYTSGEPKNLRDNPDEVHAFIPPGDVHLYLDFNNKDSLGDEYDLLLDRSTRKVDQYVTFLTSDQAKATLVNNSIDDDSACVILKDSFGNPFSYYLTQHYHYVYVLDLRYYGYRGIVSFVDQFNVSDVIMIHSSGMCYSEDTLSVVKHLLR